MNWLTNKNVLMAEAGGEGGGGENSAPANPPAGALNGGENSAPANPPASEVNSESGAYDFTNATPEDYFGKVEVPSIDGIEFNRETAMKNYAQFCIDNKIAPEVLSKYLALEGGLVAEQNKAAAAEEAAQQAEARKNFEAQGAALKREFSPQQISTAVEALTKDFSRDKDFMRVATREMSNNPSLVRLLINWAETHKTDNGTGVGNGIGGGSERGFAARWTGKNY